MQSCFCDKVGKGSRPSNNPLTFKEKSHEEGTSFGLRRKLANITQIPQAMPTSPQQPKLIIYQAVH
jgi:hypothetical protein